MTLDLAWIAITVLELSPDYLLRALCLLSAIPLFAWLVAAK